MADMQTSGPSASALNDETHNQITHGDTKSRDPDVSDKNIDDASEEHMQDGVRQAEALTQSWTKKSLGVAYAL